MISFEAKLKPALVVGDGEKLRTIVDNLISNAIKYSPRSGDHRAQPFDAGRLRASSTSSTRGMASTPASASRFSTRSTRGVPPTEGRVKGSGLGLAIAREYALAHGGRIEVLERADGRAGALFRLWLPLAAEGAGAVIDTGATEATVTTMGSR